MSKTTKLKIDFIGIGALKCATSWIFQCLKEHPEICGSSKKEINFFDNSSNYSKGIEYYKSFFKHCLNNKIIGEFTPHYIFSPQAPLLIYKHFPDVKLIACLRNPVDRAYSLYKYNVQMKTRFIIYKNFEEAIKREPILVEQGLYYKQLKIYFDLFLKENILVLFYEDIKNDPIKFMQRIYKFLDLKNPNFIPSYANKRGNITGTKFVQFKIPFIMPFMYKFISLTGRRIKIRSGSLLENLIGKLVKKLENFNKKKIIIQKNVKVLSIPLPKKETRIYLNKIYKRDIQRLKNLLNKDLSFWK